MPRTLFVVCRADACLGFAARFLGGEFHQPGWQIGEGNVTEGAAVQELVHASALVVGRWRNYEAAIAPKVDLGRDSAGGIGDLHAAVLEVVVKPTRPRARRYRRRQFAVLLDQRVKALLAFGTVNIEHEDAARLAGNNPDVRDVEFLGPAVDLPAVTGRARYPRVHASVLACIRAGGHLFAVQLLCVLSLPPEARAFQGSRFFVGHDVIHREHLDVQYGVWHCCRLEARGLGEDRCFGRIIHWFFPNEMRWRRRMGALLHSTFWFRDRLREGWGAGRLVACYSLQCVLPEQGGFGRNQTAVSDLVVERAVVG